MQKQVKFQYYRDSAVLDDKTPIKEKASLQDFVARPANVEVVLHGKKTKRNPIGGGSYTPQTLRGRSAPTGEKRQRSINPPHCNKSNRQIRKGGKTTHRGLSISSRNLLPPVPCRSRGCGRRDSRFLPHVLENLPCGQST